MNDTEVNHVRRSGGQRVLERGSRERKREREALPWLQLTQQERLPWLQPYQGHASRRRRFIPALLCLIFHLAPLLFLSSFSQVHSFFLFSFFFQALFGCWENVGKCKKPTLHSGLFMYKASVLLNCILVNCGLTCSGIFAPSISLSWILQTQKIRLMNDVGTG